MTWSEKAIGKALDFFRAKRRTYISTYEHPEGQRCLEDLMKFCRANETCFVDGDERRTMMLEGRREVWLYIQKYLRFSSEELLRIQMGQTINMTEDDNA
jgi:hypothetical protein